MRPSRGNGNGGLETDDEVLALRALAWIMTDENRAHRFLALTGLDADRLRHGIGDRAVLAAVLDFLANHEPDLVACAEELSIAPEQLISAGKALSR